MMALEYKNPQWTHSTRHSTSQAPPTQCRLRIAEPAPVRRGAGWDQPISTACLCRCDPGESGQHGLPVAAPALPVSEARRQTPCMPAWHSWGARRARWGRGHKAAAGEDEGMGDGEGPNGKGGEGEKGRLGKQTETWRRGQTMKKKKQKPAKLKKTRGEQVNSMTAGFMWERRGERQRKRQ